MTEKRLFSQDVITQQNDKENVLTSPRASSAPSSRRTAPVPPAAVRRDAADARRARAASARVALDAGRAARLGASSVGDDDNDDDEAMDDDEDAADSATTRAIGGGVRGVSRKSVEWASRQQRLLDAAARGKPSRSSSRRTR